MATAPASRSLARASLRASSSAFQTTTRASGSRFAPIARQTFRQQSRRGYASEAGAKTGSKTWIYALFGAGALGGSAYFYSQNSAVVKEAVPFIPKFEDYQAVYNAVAKKLEDEDEYEDGSYGPVILRLAWHASGTYDSETNTGGSNGATMRFAPESDHGANAGLVAARNFLAPIKEQFPWITWSDLWILAGGCAIQEMQGPVIPYRPGRSDRDLSYCTPDGRLPDGSKTQDHIRAIFGRMGFNDQEMVALSGAHALGRCHTDRSGFDGPWTFSPTVMSNDYYKLLLDEKWQYKKWDGPKQFEDKKTKGLMMLPTDMALVQDKKFKAWVEKYAVDQEKFFEDFSNSVTKLFELGVPFTQQDSFRFKTKAEQEA